VPVKPFVLQFPASELPKYAAEFSYKRDPSAAIAAGDDAAKEGCYTKEGLCEVVNWKSARSKPLVTSSSTEIEEATSTAFASTDEAARMEALTALPGVEVPIASALLLFACGDDYPILDVKALASLGHKGRSLYPTSFWLRYLECVRKLAAQNSMTAREVEKALWEWETQRRKNC
jgi:hypothetical protein